MPENWSYAKNGQRFGPFTFEQFRQMAVSGLLMPTEMVCNDDANQWVSGNSVRGLFSSSVTQNASVPKKIGADQQGEPFVTSDKWYFAKDGKKCGPITFHQLRQGVGK
jgi:hypothetical protein